MVKKIEVPSNVNYLNEWTDFELPRGIVNKGITGCGATTLAIEDAHKCIIFSPRLNLIKNKTQQHKETLAVYGDVNKEVIENYLKNTKKPKIMATYDSASRLSDIIEDKSDWRVVVDEYQFLLIDSSFKSETEIRLMEVLRDFPYVTYLSATPIADKYMLDMEWFKDMPYTILKWKNVEKRFVKRVQSKNPKNEALKIVRNYQKNNYPSMFVNGEKIESKECVIFLNSVTNIVNIIKQTDLQADEVNIIVASTDENKTLVKKLGEDFCIGAIPLEKERHKKFTFCTSTAFAGCDFYSTCASTFVISDNKRVHTSIDIATELAQIAGRQRLECNPFRNMITFIYNVDIGECENDYKSILKDKLHNSEDYAEYKNSLRGDVRKLAIKETTTSQKLNKYCENYVYYKESIDKFLVNEMAYLNDCFSYDVQKENYLDGITVRKQLEDSGFNVYGKEQYSDYEEQLECIIKKESFADRMKRYCEYRKNKESNMFFFALEVMERQYEDLKLFYDSLGYERIKALGYKEKDLKNEIKSKKEIPHLYNEFRRFFPVGTKMLTDDIKSKMAKVYAKYGIKKTCVVANLGKLYGIKIRPVKIPLGDGSRKNGFKFI